MMCGLAYGTAELGMHTLSRGPSGLGPIGTSTAVDGTRSTLKCAVGCTDPNTQHRVDAAFVLGAPPSRKCCSLQRTLVMGSTTPLAVTGSDADPHSRPGRSNITVCIMRHCKYLFEKFWPLICVHAQLGGIANHRSRLIDYLHEGLWRLRAGEGASAIHTEEGHACYAARRVAPRFLHYLGLILRVFGVGLRGRSIKSGLCRSSHQIRAGGVESVCKVLAEEHLLQRVLLVGCHLGCVGQQRVSFGRVGITVAGACEIDANSRDSLSQPWVHILQALPIFKHPLRRHVGTQEEWNPLDFDIVLALMHRAF
jgi:hypothetical protein